MTRASGRPSLSGGILIVLTKIKEYDDVGGARMESVKIKDVLIIPKIR